MIDGADSGAGPRGGGSAFCCSCPGLRVVAPSAGGIVFLCQGLKGPSGRLGWLLCIAAQNSHELGMQAAKKIQEHALSKPCLFLFQPNGILPHMAGAALQCQAWTVGLGSQADHGIITAAHRPVF